MRSKIFPTLGLAVLALTGSAFAQRNTTPAPPPMVKASPAPKMAAKYAAIIAAIPPGEEVSSDRRAQAYAKLFEAQRMIWKATRSRPNRTTASFADQAGAALNEAVTLDPKLAEAYTALAEISLNTGETDLDETIALCRIATGLDADNFGSHRILARLFTFRSRIAGRTLDPEFTGKAIAEWKEIARLDPRNAEAWAFLSEYYDRAGETDLQIDALRKWVGAAAPIETQFYEQVMGRGSSLDSQTASLKLAPALLKTGKTREAIEVLSTVIADDPENDQAVELLRQAVSSGKPADAALAIEALEQAGYANPESVSLIVLLADVRAKAGKLDDAVDGLNKAAKSFEDTEPASAGLVLMSLGDLYAEKDRSTDAITTYERALKAAGYETEAPPTDSGRTFVMTIFEKMIKLYSIANRPEDVRATIERARKLLGKQDLFADRQIISYYREKGDRESALAAVRDVRKRLPNDEAFLRLEASVLAESGQIDEAVRIFRSEKQRMKKAADSSTAFFNGADEYSDAIYLSNLYSEAGRPKEAAAAANEAYGLANGLERKQIAKLTLASAQQNAGEFEAAEATLRAILKESPNNPIASNNLGYFFLERGIRFNEALDLIKAAVDIDPTNPSFLDSLGWAYFKLGDLTEAEKHLRSALRYDPGSATINEHLGDVLMKAGRRDDAKQSWEKARILASAPADLSRIREKIAAIGK